MPADAVFRGEVVSSLTRIGRADWDACFPGEPEAYDYLLSVEKAGIAGFEWCYAVVRSGDRLVAAMPGFLSQYALETTLDPGRLRDVIGRIRHIWPKFLTFPLACLGSPCTETGSPGFHPDVPEALRPAAFETLLTAFEAFARQRKSVLGALKDVPQPLDPRLAEIIAAHGYAELGGMPTAWMDIDFASMEDYFARLSAGTRKDMRRKLKVRDKVRVEICSDAGALLPRIMELYHDTRTRSEWQFEELTPAYFEGILKNMPGRSFCTLYFVDDQLLAANLMVHDGAVLVDKFFCMDAEKGRPYNLYYLSWFTNIEYCLTHGLKRYQSGQAYYRNKVRLGSQLTANAMYFRHSNALVQRLLQRVAPYLAADDTDGTAA
nr:peptidogalycan biosysnthesis protein [Rhizobium paknamense]